MKKTILYLGAALIAVFLLTNFKSTDPQPEVVTSKAEFEIPENINAILQHSCYGCHNTESRGEKSKKKLNLDSLTYLSTPKLVAKLNKIGKELEEGKMPPEKFLAKYPDKAPSAEDKQTLIDWAHSSATSLMEE